MNPIEVYERCLSGRPYSKDFCIYTKKYLERVIEELVYLEEYEKCVELNKFIKQRFNHELNYNPIS